MLDLAAEFCITQGPKGVSEIIRVCPHKLCFWDLPLPHPMAFKRS